ncbi:hypothetical protein AAC387_Pa05g0762 [Persea americana]
MEEPQQGNSPKTDEKHALGFSSPSPSPPPPPVDVSDLEKLDLDLQNLWLKEDDWNPREQVSVPKDEKKRRFSYPIRPGEPDCVFYLRTGSCRFATNCKFNHPRRRKNQVGKDKAKEKEKDKEKDEKEKEKEKKEVEVEHENDEEEEVHEKEGQQECKYYLKAGGCKFGKACRYNHSREQAGAGEPADLNFLGLPIRPGERECPFYMRTGSCKFAINCRFHHPDPTAVGGSDPTPVYQNDTSLQVHASAESSPLPAAWALQSTSSEPAPYMEASPQPYPPAMLQPLHGVHPNPEWNTYMGLTSPIFPSERHMQAPSASGMNDQTKKANSSTRQLHTKVEEFPKKPGQSECQYFMKFGYCKFKSACRYHHPKKRVSKSTACVLSPMGLPLRPDQTTCVHYSRYGICKFGPACRHDHPINSGPLATPVTPASDRTPTFDKSTSEEAGVLTC